MHGLQTKVGVETNRLIGEILAGLRQRTPDGINYEIIYINTMNLNAVETKITVDGKSCDFIYMKLDQSMTGHHFFEIAVSYRHKKQSVWALTVDDIFRETLNKQVAIQMSHIETGETNEFYGIVTDIEAVGIDGDKGTVILRGGSPTILLDRDPAMASFVDYTLYNVVAETIENTGIQVELKNKPFLKRTIPYLARYKESSYAFLSRVLYSFGEWFYYDGRKLVVGNPMTNKEKRVTYDVELLEVRSMAKLQNLNTKYYDYDPAQNNYFEEASGTINNANLLMKGAKQVSDPLYPSVAKLPVGREVLGETDMSNVVRIKQSREYTKMSLFTAKCSSCGVKVGEIATALIPEFPDVKFNDLGSFRVLEVQHRVDKDGHYENTFKGITSQSETLPDDHIKIPQAFQEPAMVVDNADPRNLGRVKVRYFWQAEDASTNWIRVQTPDAGQSDAVDKNRGFVFIPEVGDQVMVGFLYGDPSRPYVMGSLFHVGNTKGAATDNSIRTISTKSGHTIEFNDSKDAIGIVIKDTSGNTIHLNTLGKNIVISAPEAITFTSKHIQLDASDSVGISAQKNMEVMVTEQISFNTNKMMIEAEEKVSTTTKEIDSLADKVRIDSTKENLELASGKSVDIQSSEKVKLF